MSGKCHMTLVCGVVDTKEGVDSEEKEFSSTFRWTFLGHRGYLTSIQLRSWPCS